MGPSDSRPADQLGIAFGRVGVSPQFKKRQRLLTAENTPYWNENFQGDYAIRIKQFASGLGIPCIAPPWGRMVGVDLATGKTMAVTCHPPHRSVCAELPHMLLPQVRDAKRSSG